MIMIIAGEPAGASTLAAGPEMGPETTVWSHESTSAQDSVSALAAALVGFEAEVSGQQVDSIVLADDSDAALAAALVGTKLPVDVYAVEDALDAPSPNGRLIAQLAAAYTPPA